MAKRLSWEEMTGEQREKVRRVSEKYGVPVEEIIMKPNGLIVLTPGQAFGVKQQMVAKGWADSVDEITPAMIRRYQKDMGIQTEEDDEKPKAAKPVRIRRKADK